MVEDDGAVIAKVGASGAACNVKEVELVPVPEEFVTEIVPLVVSGANAVIWVALTTVKETASTPLNLTDVAALFVLFVFLKPVPVIVTCCPAQKDVGKNEVTVGIGGFTTVIV